MTEQPRAGWVLDRARARLKLGRFEAVAWNGGWEVRALDWHGYSQCLATGNADDVPFAQLAAEQELKRIADEIAQLLNTTVS